MDIDSNTTLKILLVKTRGRSTATLAERVAGEEQGLGPRGTLFERSLGCDVIDESTIETMGGRRGLIYSKIPTFIAQSIEATRRSSDYDAVVTWSERHTIGVAALFALRRVHTPHVALMFWLSKPAVRIPLQVFRSGVDRIVTWSSVQRGVAVDTIGFNPADISLVNHPVDLEFFHPISDERTIIFSAGSTQRDFPTLSEAVTNLGIPVRIAASLVVRLRGLKIDTTDVRESLDHPANVEIKSMNAIELRASYAQAKIVVVPLLPSTIDAGVNVILEGMAMGRPVIASRTEGQVDVVEHGENGLFVDPQDADGLRSSIEHLLNNPDVAEEMGRKARAYVEENHRLEGFIERVRQILVDVAEQGPRRQGMWRRTAAGNKASIG